MAAMISDPMTTVTTIPVSLHADTSGASIRWVREESDPIVRQIEQYSQLTGLPFWCVACDPSGPRVSYSPSHTLPMIPDRQFSEFRNAIGPHVVELDSGLTFYSLPLPPGGDVPLLALGWVRLRPDRRPDEVVLRAVQMGWTRRRVDEWLDAQPYASSQFVSRLLEGIWSQLGSQRREEGLRSELVIPQL